MKYDFDNIADRKNTTSIKWEEKDVIPMFIADMDFKAPNFITDKLKEIVNVDNFGYKDVPDEYFLAYKAWWHKRHHFDFEVEDCVFSTGVVPAISSIVRKLTTIGEKVLVTKPCYNVFFNSIVNNGRFIISSDLVLENNTYHLDFSDLETKMKDPQVSLMILCNPENPIGKIWTRDELIKIGELASKYNVLVLSDEIHCDIVAPGKEYIPFASVNDTNRYNSITCISASKCFSLAGLQGACVVVPNKNLRHKVWRGINTDEVGECNSFVCETFISCFTHGEEWINEMNEYVYKNKMYAREFIKENLRDAKYIESDSLYLIWVDVSAYTKNVDILVKYLSEVYKVHVSSGAVYGECAKTFLRINLATSLNIVKEGLLRIKNGILSYNGE